ncbi:MAG: anhydro-N-acetylmuramic acid kinase [Ignavibacteriae bacterium]|nr:anhydro-N-acetylmuramic acid kinase [Ignavibacteriota bacterium]
MTNLHKILNKSERLVIGVLSGTSVDAVDIALIKFKGKGENVSLKVLEYKEYKIPAGIKEFVFKVSHKESGSVDDVCRLNFILGKFYAACINKFLKQKDISAKKVDAIGSHGQTIHHLPLTEKFNGIKYKSTLQIGDPSVIANQTGIITIGDFRTADVAHDGGGAPLVPYLDFVMFRSNKTDRILLNIGGISNLTCLPAKCKFSDVVAFDTGPGNMMIDYLSQKFYSKSFDKDCRISKKGTISKKLLSEIKKKDTFLLKKYPKSTGRELYHKSFVDSILKNYKSEPKENILRTFTEYTSYSVSGNIKRLLKLKNNKFELLVSGGGASNCLIMDGLKNNLPNATVTQVNSGGITTSNKEAVLFALLANETLNGNTTNLKSVTGAKKNAILGKICLV